MKITKAQTKKRDRLIGKVQELANALDEAFSEFEDFREEIAEEQTEKWEAKSEAWQDGEVGAAANEWIAMWQESEDTYLETLQNLDVDLYPEAQE